MAAARGRPVGSLTKNRSSGSRTGPKGPREANFGPPVRTNPWTVAGPTVRGGVGAGLTSASVGTGLLGFGGGTSGSDHASSVDDVRSVDHGSGARETAAGTPTQQLGGVAQSPKASTATRTTAAAAAAAAVNASSALDPDSMTGGQGPAMATFINSVKREVDSKMTRKGHGVKHCVHGSLDRGSPWFHPDGPLHSKIPDRHAHWRTPVFVCIWEFLDPSIKAPPCPFCESSEHVVSDGWDPQSRTVHGEHYNFEMIGKQHRCNNCKVRSEKGKGKKGSTGVRYKFAAWNPGVLRLLPRDLQELFPAVILRRSAVAVELITRIEQTLVSSMGLATLANDIRENHLKYHMKMQIRYYARFARIRSRKQQSLFAKENELLQNPPLFGDFDDETGYNGRPPSAAVLQSAWIATFEGKLPWYYRQQQQVDGTNLAGDGSHKVVKAIRLADKKVFSGMYTILNEYNQVVMQRPMRHVSVGSMAELEPSLKALARRFNTQGFLPIQVVWTDMCCADRKVFQSALGPASKPLTDPAAPSSDGKAKPPLRDLTLPAGETPAVIVVKSEKCESSAHACTQLLKRARESEPAMLGFDCEWSVRASGPRPVATVQMSALDGYTVIFHLKYREDKPGIMPKALKELMENKSVLKAGVSVGRDLTLVSNSYGVDGKAPADLGQLAGKHLAIGVGARSLAALVETLLSRRLPKDGVRMSDWETSLSLQQVTYAALDSYSSALLFRHIMERADPIFTARRPIVGTLEVGTSVRLYTKTNSRVVGVGTLMDYPGGKTWGNTGLAIGNGSGAGRMVLQLDKIFVPGALAIHPSENGGEPQALDDIRVGGIVLWEATNSRLPERPPPVHIIPGSGGLPEGPPTTVPGAVEMEECLGSTASSVLPANKACSEMLEGDVRAPDVKLDLFHAENRLIEVARKTHGAYRPFCAALRDALAIPDPEGLGRVIEVMAAKHPTWTKWEVEAYVRRHFTSHVLTHVQRVVPQPPIGLPRFDGVVGTFRFLRDGCTDEPFFTPRMEKAAKNLREHLAKGCLSDPDPRKVPLYQVSGRTRDGLDKLRSMRGTNRVESYHTPLRRLMGAYQTSPTMAHYSMLLHNYRRNHRMAGKYRGMDPKFLGWYSHYDLEYLQALTWEWFETPLFAGWESTKNFRDTGELAGLVTAGDPQTALKELNALSSVCELSDAEMLEDQGSSDDEDGEGRELPTERWGPLDGLTSSARCFARMQGLPPGERPITAVETPAEIDKFDHEVLHFLIPEERRKELIRSGHRVVCAIDCERFADKWNADVAKTRENWLAGRLDVSNDPSMIINKKAPFDLQNQWTQSRKDANTARTVEKNKAALNQMYRNQRVRIMTPSSEGQAAIAVTTDGGTITFPSVHRGPMAPPRPAPPVGAEILDERLGSGGVDGPSSDNVDIDVGMSDYCCVDVNASDQRRGTGVTMESSLGGAEIGGDEPPEAPASMPVGDPVYVAPAQACSSLLSVMPTFGIGGASANQQQLWNGLPSLEQPSPPPRQPSRVSTCQTCGHNAYCGRMGTMHSGGGRYQPRVCSVPQEMRRGADFPKRSRNRYNRCACAECK